MIGPSQFLVVWLDGEPGESSGSEPHASFRVAPTAGVLALSRVAAPQPMILDYLTYNLPTPGHSFGCFPDGNRRGRQRLFYATPGGTNNPATAPVRVFINEWMADNTGVLADPADGDYEDWFELYNPEAEAVDLGGCYLTDNLTNKAQFLIPAGTVIRAQGYLLAWADGETGQNSTNRPDLHVSFKLDKAGEALGLFAPDGTPIDAVTFGPQTNNVSEKRYPDKMEPRLFIPTPTPRTPNIPPEEPTEPDLSGVLVSADGLSVSFAFRTEAGRQYQVQFKDDLGAPDWQPLGGIYFGTGNPIEATDVIGARAQRFYRVVLLP